ncbi:MAG: ABC transporter permease subunit [Candidatus Aenigmatarchaeota archaeon]
MLVLVYCLFNVPLAVWVLETYVESIPTEIEEAAFIDVCNISQIWRYILIPVMAPALVTVSILMFIAAWNEYLFALILTITQSRTWTIGSQIFIGTHRVLWGELAASGILGIVPPLILITLIRSRIVEGLTLGRFKG